MEDRDPRVGSRYVIEKSSSYTWWESRWQSYADRLDAVELEGRRLQLDIALIRALGGGYQEPQTVGKR